MGEGRRRIERGEGEKERRGRGCENKCIDGGDESVKEEEEIPAGKRRNPAVQLDGSGPIVVIIRHGKTEYNKLGLFTGEAQFYCLALLKYI